MSIVQRVATVLIVGLGIVGKTYADDVSDAKETVTLFKKTDPGLDRFFKDSVGYAVFPSVGKGAFILGGAHGSGILYEGGEPVGHASLTQASVGFQFGGEAYAEIIFFETEQVLSNFKSGNFAFSGQVSGVVLASGAAANANYQWGVVVFTAAKGGLVVDASLGGPKVQLHPIPKE
jgi:lipid-binding SYLF domain-containing protein